jgi:hypothetical protein
LDERAIGMLRQRRGDGGGELLDVRHEWEEDCDERADDFTTGFSFGVANLGRGGRRAGGRAIGHRLGGSQCNETVLPAG